MGVGSAESIRRGSAKWLLVLAFVRLSARSQLREFRVPIDEQRRFQGRLAARKNRLLTGMPDAFDYALLRMGHPQDSKFVEFMQFRDAAVDPSTEGQLAQDKEWLGVTHYLAVLSLDALVTPLNLGEGEMAKYRLVLVD